MERMHRASMVAKEPELKNNREEAMLTASIVQNKEEEAEQSTAYLISFYHYSQATTNLLSIKQKAHH
eukprot:3656053-Ditylum_brightwellii.AAC.1